MEKKKSHKFMIPIVLLTVVLMGAIGALVGVYAATQQNVKSSFSVSYDVGINVALKVTSSYQIAGEDKVDLPEIRFNVADASQTKTVEIPEIVLTGEKPYVDFSYRFDPLNDTVMTLLPCWNNLLENSHNIKITGTYYFMNNSGATIWNGINPDNYDFFLSGNSTLFSIDGLAAANYFPIETSRGWDYMQCDYRFEIDDPNKDAFITSSSEVGLHFIIEAY